MLSAKREIGSQARLRVFAERLLYSREDRLILSCVRHTTDSTRALLGTTLRWDHVINRGSASRVSPWVYFHLKSLSMDCPIPADALDRLRTVTSSQMVHMMRLVRVFEEIAGRFSEKGIETIVLKGVALAATVYESPGFRMADDLDLLLSPADLAAGAQALRDLGFKQPPNNLSPDHHHLPAFQNEERLTVELHRDIVPSSASHSIPVEKLWQHSRPVRIGGVRGRMFGPEHLLLHAALHAASGHAFFGMLFQLCDIRAVVSRFAQEIDWDFLLAEIRESSIEWPVYWAFRLAVDLTGAAIPERIVNEIEPRYARWSPRHALLFTMLPRVALTFGGSGFLMYTVSRALQELLKENGEWIAWGKVAKRLLGPRQVLKSLGRLRRDCERRLTNPVN